MSWLVAPPHLPVVTTSAGDLKLTHGILPSPRDGAAKRTEAHGETRREEKKWDQRTFLLIGLCMQQASKARAEQKSLVGGRGRPFLSSLWSTAEAAHLQGWVGGGVLIRVAAEVPDDDGGHFSFFLNFE